MYSKLEFFVFKESELIYLAEEIMNEMEKIYVKNPLKQTPKEP